MTAIPSLTDLSTPSRDAARVAGSWAVAGATAIVKKRES